jgi:hypothetical protein
VRAGARAGMTPAPPLRHDGGKWSEVRFVAFTP